MDQIRMKSVLFLLKTREMEFLKIILGNDLPSYLLKRLKTRDNA